MPTSGEGQLHLDLGLCKRGAPVSARFLAFEGGLSRKPGKRNNRLIDYNPPRISLVRYNGKEATIEIDTMIRRIATIETPKLVTGGPRGIEGLIQLSYQNGAYAETPQGWLSPKVRTGDFRFTTGFGHVGFTHWTLNVPFAYSLVLTSPNLTQNSRTGFVRGRDWTQETHSSSFGNPNVKNILSYYASSVCHPCYPKNETGSLDSMNPDIRLSEKGRYSFYYYNS